MAGGAASPAAFKLERTTSFFFSASAMKRSEDFYSGAAWSAMPSVATRPISVVDVCCRHTLHVSWQPAVVPSASICLPLRKVCLLLLVNVLLSARKWWVK